MKKCIVALAMMVGVMFAMTASANFIVDPGLEDGTPRVVADGGDAGTWASFPGGWWDATLNDGAGGWVPEDPSWTVVDTMARSGSQAIQTGVAGNVRQGYMPDGAPESVENKTWTAGAWIYYDDTAGSDAGDWIDMQLLVTNDWNVHRVNEAVQISATNIIPNTWTYFELIGVAGEYDPEGEPGRITDRVKIVFNTKYDQGEGNAGQFYIDDVSLIPEPGTIALLGLMGFALFIRRRFSK